MVSVYQTLTSVPGGGAVLFGGRTSPLNPMGNIVWVTFDLGDQPSQSTIQLSFKNMVCTGCAPKPRWRHTSTCLSHRGKRDNEHIIMLVCFFYHLKEHTMNKRLIFPDKTFLCVFGGRTEKDAVLGDAHFLCLENKHWTEAWSNFLFYIGS